MKKAIILLVIMLFGIVGCDTLRFAPTEQQKQNAWLHNRTTTVAAEAAKAEKASDKLQALTELSQLQSRVFVSYHGLPKQFPHADTAEDILDQASFTLARTALAESAERPDAFELADSAFELAIGICALLGGVYGTRAVGFLRESRTKSKALREIIEGNELFKRRHTDLAAEFKESHKNQSPQTRRVVAQMKT